MKTPREILFERHRSAEPKLDAIRQTLLARSRRREEAGAQAASPIRLLTTAASFRELLLSVRWHLAGMSAALAVAALLNMDPSHTPAQTTGKHSTSSPRQILTALRENRRQLLELIGPPITEPAPAPRTLVPQRRGETQSANAMV